jgi:Flp pilus assembly protein TadG
MRSRPSKNKRGVAAVEFALVLPLLMLLVLGGLDWGFYFYVTQIVTNAAREGAREGSLEITNATLAQTNATNTARNFINLAGLNGGLATISSTAVGNAIRVNISFPAGSLTGFTQIVMPTAVVAQAEMRRL